VRKFEKLPTFLRRFEKYLAALAVRQSAKQTDGLLV